MYALTPALTPANTQLIEWKYLHSAKFLRSSLGGLMSLAPLLYVSSGEQWLGVKDACACDNSHYKVP